MATLSLMILLSILAVGMLTLSGVALRSSSQDEAICRARSNARMAMMLALGGLQKQTGQDTRVTARADILAEKNPLVLGVWKSWEGSDHETSGTFLGRPKSPGNDENVKESRFQGWLVSGDRDTLMDAANVPDVTAAVGKATLVGENSVGSDQDRKPLQVHLTRSEITGSKQRGSFAWWIAGENQKARIPNPYKPASDRPAGWANHAKSHAVADPDVFRLGKLLQTPELADKAITLGQSDLISIPASLKTSQEFFHDLSATSTGLLTNTATGGWKKDLSLLTENWVPGASNLPLFHVKPGEDILSNMPNSGNPTPSKSMLYPWASYRNGGAPIDLHGPVTSWENLTDYALLYKNRITSAGSSGRCTIPPYSVSITGDKFTFLHRVRVLPVIARIQWVLSHSAGTPPPPANGQAPYPPGSLEPRLLLTPVITVWNPYNVEITMDGANVPMLFNIRAPLPVALQYTINGVQNQRFNSLYKGGTNTPSLANSNSLIYQIDSPFTLIPGETRIFSPAENDIRSADDSGNKGPEGVSKAGPTLPLKVGYRSTGGHYFALKNDNDQKIVTPGSSTMKVSAKFDTAWTDGGSTGVGVYFDYWSMGSPKKRTLAYRMNVKPAVATALYQPISNLAESDQLTALVDHPVPFMTTVFGARMANKTHLAAKGFVQSSPLVNYTELGGKDEVVASIQWNYPGTDHPVNSPFDYSFEAVAGAGDSLLPNANDATGRGYIVTGFNKSDGLSRCVIAELPTRPYSPSRNSSTGISVGTIPCPRSLLT